MRFVAPSSNRRVSRRGCVEALPPPLPDWARSSRFRIDDAVAPILVSDMIEASWLLFVVASLVLIATPGQDMILVMSRSVAQGVAAGVATAAGVSVGLVGHTVRCLFDRQ